MSIASAAVIWMLSIMVRFHIGSNRELLNRKASTFWTVSLAR